MVTTLILPPLLALIASSIVIAVLIKSPAAMLVLDHPNHRSLHETPTPRLGGIGIVAGIAAAWSYASPAIDGWVLVALGVLIGISLLDDLKDVAVGWRMGTHVVCAAIAATAILRGHEPWEMALAAIAIAWMINLYNFMDGADGLAGGMTVIGFGTYGIAALLCNDLSFAAANLAVAAAALGFLLFNFPPARIFMGDIGAIPLGCLAAAFNLYGWLHGDWPVWFGAVVFSPFIVDASVTLIKRLLRGTPVWRAHREHYYQRLVQSGWGHRKTALAEYALMLSCGGVAIAGIRLEQSAQLAILAAFAALYTALIVAVERHVPRHA